MKPILFFCFALFCISSCKKDDSIEAYDPFTYASWSKVGEVGPDGKEISVIDPNQSFVRSWSGWTLVQPPKGLDSVFFKKGNNVLFRDRVSKVQAIDDQGRFYLTTDKGMEVEIKFVLPTKTNNDAYLYVTKIEGNEVKKGYFDKFVFVKSN